MNLRTLKKLSKRAAPLIVQLDDRREQFPAQRDDNYHGCLIANKKHWERRKVHATYEPRNDYSTRRGAEVLKRTRKGNLILLKPPTHPRKGTVMVGGVCGYEQPEWSEECAWFVLDSIVRDHFTDWDKAFDENIPPGGSLTRELRLPSQILKAAHEIIELKRKLTR
jgi:hypothetical protein